MALAATALPLAPSGGRAPASAGGRAPASAVGLCVPLCMLTRHGSAMHHQPSATPLPLRYLYVYTRATVPTVPAPAACAHTLSCRDPRPAAASPAAGTVADEEAECPLEKSVKAYDRGTGVLSMQFDMSDYYNNTECAHALNPTSLGCALPIGGAAGAGTCACARLAGRLQLASCLIGRYRPLVCHSVPGGGQMRQAKGTPPRGRSQLSGGGRP